MLETKKIHCPCCGEIIEIVVEPSAGEHQQYIEDCFVCCRPIILTITADFDSGEVEVYAASEDE
jgi:hypothetical protein